jgi:hypothetical protein
MAIRWLRIMPLVFRDVSSISKRRPCLELVVALNVDSEPTSLVPGSGEDAHGLGSLFVNCGGGA